MKKNNILFVICLILSFGCNKYTLSKKKLPQNSQSCLSEVGCNEVTGTSETLMTLNDFANAGTRLNGITQNSGDNIFLSGRTTGVGGTNDAFLIKFNTTTEALESNFGVNGSLILDQTFAQSFSGAYVDGNSVYGFGQDDAPSSGSLSTDILIRRFDATTGNPDTTFNGTGRVVQNYIGNWADSSYDLNALSDNKLYSCGYAYKNGTTSYDAVISRYSMAGVIDTSFGSSGHLFIDFGGNPTESCYKILELPSGQILIYGVYIKVGFNYQPFVQRYNSDWTLDTAFGSAGTLKINYNIYSFISSPSSVVLDQDNLYLIGSIVLTNGAPSQAAIVKLDISNGSIDSTFGTDGMLLLTPGCNPTDSSNVNFSQLLNNSILLRGSCSNTNKSVSFIVPVLKSGAVDPLFNNSKSFYYLEDPTVDLKSTAIHIKLESRGAKIYTFNLGVIKAYDLKW